MRMERVDFEICPSVKRRDAAIGELIRRYRQLKRGVLGYSYLGRQIPLLSVGEGATQVLYVGAHHGAEGITEDLLLSFLADLPGSDEEERILSGLTLRVVPCLNPDGVAIAGDGVETAGTLAGRLREMNPTDDFTKWQANARGVDLNHNYREGFDAYKGLEPSLGIFGGGPTRYSGEYPESEPETAALADFIREKKPALILSLHTQGEVIYYPAAGREIPGVVETAEALGRLSGYSPEVPEGPASLGGLCDWTTALGIPSFTVECGRGENPLPREEKPAIYRTVRPLLFGALRYAGRETI